MDRSDERLNIWREQQTKAVGANPGRPSERMKEPGEILSPRHTQEQGRGRRSVDVAALRPAPRLRD